MVAHVAAHRALTAACPNGAADLAVLAARADYGCMSDFMSRFESLIDKQIRDAQARGAFDELPGQGKPLADDGAPYDEDWWLKQLAKRDDVGPYALPEPLALRRLAQDLRAGDVEARSEAEVRAAAEKYNARAEKARRRTYSGPSVHIPSVDVEQAVAAWRAHRAAG